MKIKTGKFLIGKRINIVLILSVLLLFVTIAIPSFCMLLTKDNSNEIEYWSGTIASNYSSGSGTEDDPYIISNGEELAYFADEINKGTTYDGKYFKLANNIHLNNGVIEYKNNLILYTKDSIKYYIKPFTNEYYKDSEYTNKIGIVNIFPQMKTFRGNIDGNDKFIYGLYLTDEIDYKVNLFEEHSNGQIKNLYFSNTLLYGNYTVGLINKTQNGTYNNLIFNGNIYSTGLDLIKTYNLEDVQMTETSKNINITTETLPEMSETTKISLKGTLTGESITINNNLITEEEFELELEEIPSTLTVEANVIGSIITNLNLEIYYNDNISSLINNLENSRINNTFIRGNVTGKYITAPLVGYATNNLELNNSFNDANVFGTYITSGLIGVMKNASTNMGSIYNSGNINGQIYTGGIYGAIYSSYNINLHDSFNIGLITGETKGAIAGTSSIDIIDHNNYYTNENTPPVGNNASIAATHINKSTLLEESFLTKTLKFTSDMWTVSNNELPKLITFDNIAPNVTIKLLDYTWENINTETIKIKEQTWLDVEYKDQQSDILKVEYYIGNKIYQEEEINNLEFNLYNDTIKLEENGNYYIIFKTTDVVGNINITTTNLINLDGYNLEITDIYNNQLKKYDNQISYNSSIKYNFHRTYKMDNFIYPEETIHSIKTNILLPNNTNIKLIDNINNKIYVYTVNNQDVIEIENSYIYKLSLFKELGKITDEYFNKKIIDYYQNNILKENYDIILNFKNTEIDKNKTIKLDLITTYEDTIYTTTYTNLNNTFKLIKYDDNNNEVGYNYNLTTDFKDYIDMSKIDTYSININNEIQNSKINNKDIYNENIDSNNLHLLIQIYDSSESLITGNLINSLTINYNEDTYYSSNQGYIKIPFTNNNININLNTNYIINDIINGLYYLKIKSCDTRGICSNEEIIPIKVLNNITNIECNYKINIDNLDRLIRRSNGLNLNNKNSMNINIDYQGKLTNPNIRIKLYKKLNFDSNNQVYELLDLSSYISNNLELIKDYQYYLIKELKDNQNINLNFIINNFEYGGYKLSFELYDGESFVKEESKTFIVK